MQTRNQRGPACLGGLRPWILVFILGAVAAAGGAQVSPNIILSDGDVEILELPLGTDLYVKATGLPPFSEVDVLLLDWNGDEVLRQQYQVGSQGIVRGKRLWYRTGIGGCDCKLWGQGYPFRHPHEAVQMLGHDVVVRVQDAQSETLLAQKILTIVESREPLLYTSDVRGCPRERFEAAETLMLKSVDPTPAMTVFLVPHQESWEPGDPIVDVRTGFEAGQSFVASADGLNGVLWQGIESEKGEYDLLIRPGAGQGGATGLVLRPNDRLLHFFGGESFDPGNPGERGNSGLVIDDWGCH